MVESLAVANLSEGSLRQRSNLLSIKIARVIFVILKPESVNDADPFVVGRTAIGSWGVSLLSSGRLVISDSTVRDLVGTIIVLLLVGFFPDRVDDLLLLLLLLVHLLLLCCLLFFHNLMHESGLVYTLGAIETRSSLAISLHLVLVTHWNRTINSGNQRLANILKLLMNVLLTHREFYLLLI